MCVTMLSLCTLQDIKSRAVVFYRVKLIKIIMGKTNKKKNSQIQWDNGTFLYYAIPPKPVLPVPISLSSVCDIWQLIVTKCYHGLDDTRSRCGQKQHYKRSVFKGSLDALV